MDLIWTTLLLMTLATSGLGVLVNNAALRKLTPGFIVDAYLYGKSSRSKVRSHWLVTGLEVPKVYFLHFYVYASVLLPVLLFSAASVYVLGNPPPVWILWTLERLRGSRPEASPISKEAVLLALALMTAQVFRRMYECGFVNVDSGSRMNMAHYIIGYLHYTCVGLGILSEAPLFCGGDAQQQAPAPLVCPMGVVVRHLLAAAVFVWAWLHQFRAHKIFARLKRENGNRHVVPSGDWFEYVSCPHYLAECIMYLMVSLILGFPHHRTMAIVLIWVVSNQIEVARMSHNWYREKFRDSYPPSRKALIPFVF